MPEFPFVTVDVFTTERFGGNPLAVFYAADELSDAQMLSLSAEMNLSETTFVLPPADPANTARVRIFNRAHEMPFAGHPNVGTGYVLKMLGLADGPAMRFEEMAGLVDVRLSDGGAEIDAPQPLAVLGKLPVSVVSPCIGITADRIVTTTHPPVRATTGVDFVLVEVAADALGEAVPDLSAYRSAIAAHPELGGRLSTFIYARDGDGIRARMFAPLAGTWEDPATGSANATLAALLLSLTAQETIAYSAVQGVEMGRPSHLRLRAWRTPDGVRASVGGNCVPMFRGSVTL